MNRYAFFLILALTGLAAAQEKPSDTGPKIVTYEFKNVDVDRADSIVQFVGKLVPQVLIRFDGPFKTAVLQPNYNYHPPFDAGAVAQALELLKRYDVAPPRSPTVEFVAYLVRATDVSDPSARVMYKDQVTLKPIPLEIQDAVAEMKKTFAYTYYSLLDTVSTDVHHHAEVDSVFPQIAQTGVPAPFLYHIVYGDAAVSPDGKTVVVNPFKFSVRQPDWPEATGFTTDVTIHEGQKLVLGKVRTSITSSEVIFVILTVKLH
jgi:hypothetical protein